MYNKYLWAVSKLIIFLSLAVSFTVIAQEQLLVVRPDGQAFNDVVKGMFSELEGDFVIRQLLINDKIDLQGLTGEIKDVSPKLIVLMDNRSIYLFEQWQKALPDSVSAIPSVACMAFFVEKALKGVKNSLGISYEIPIVTMLTNLRATLNIPLEKVGVIHQSFASDFIQQNKEYCKGEQIELINIEMTKKVITGFHLNKGLRTLFKKDKVDAVIVLNDNSLLSPDFLRDIWIPTVNWYNKPIVVGVEVLADPKLNFGVFAVLPDHINLGHQLAEKILDIQDNNWEIEKHSVDPPLSVINVINLKKANKQFGVDEKNLTNVDKILE